MNFGTMADLIISGIGLLNLGVLFILAFLASFGVPGALPWMMYSGALADSFLALMQVIVITAVAAILGDVTAYELSKRCSLLLSTRLNKYKFFRNGEGRARELLKKYGSFVIFFTRFAFTGLGAVVNYLSGFEKLSRKKFITAVISGEIIYGIMYPLMGFAFKETWNDLANVIRDVFVVAALIIIILLFSSSLIKKHKKLL